MLAENKIAFDSFHLLHDKYAFASDTDPLQEGFNYEGEKILKIIHEWENKLCSQSEKGGYGVYTDGLSEKFQLLVRKTFPMIDHIGIIITAFKKTPDFKSGDELNSDMSSSVKENPALQSGEDVIERPEAFTLRKINLS